MKKPVDYTNIIVELDNNFKDKNLNEVIDLIYNSNDGIEKLLAYYEKYDDDIAELNEQISNLDSKYKVKIDELIKQEEELKNLNLQNIIDYNNYNQEVIEIGPSLDQTTTNKIIEIKTKLNLIVRKEKLLNGNLSKRDKDKKEELINNLKTLQQDKKDFEDLKEESKSRYDQNMLKIKILNDQRNKLIKELAKKKVKLYNERGEFRKNRKLYNYMIKQLQSKLVEEKTNIDNKYEDKINELREKIVNSSPEIIEKLTSEFIDVSKARKDFYQKNNKNIDLLNIKELVKDDKQKVLDCILDNKALYSAMNKDIVIKSISKNVDLEEKTVDKQISILEKQKLIPILKSTKKIDNQKIINIIECLKTKYPSIASKLEESAINWEKEKTEEELNKWIELFIKKNSENEISLKIYSFLWNLSIEETKEKFNNRPIDKKDIKPIDKVDNNSVDNIDVEPIEFDTKIDNKINPIKWYDEYKEYIKNDNSLNDEQVYELIEYIEQLKQEFVHLFASYARIDYNQEMINEALQNTTRLVEIKKQEILNNKVR